ncbi:hypothetical protein VNO77_12954 [Canavalia gladiata]|uniref:Uncharacterized protein n=1 Tax=Canavalia gladiata TaxID=3824 RepID=A0AAN9M204_CANGL
MVQLNKNLNSFEDNTIAIGLLIKPYALSMYVNPLDALEGDVIGWLRSKGQGSISSEGASQCFFAGKNETKHKYYFLLLCSAIVLYISDRNLVRERILKEMK